MYLDVWPTSTWHTTIQLLFRVDAFLFCSIYLISSRSNIFQCLSTWVNWMNATEINVLFSDKTKFTQIDFLNILTWSQSENQIPWQHEHCSQTVRIKNIFRLTGLSTVDWSFISKVFVVVKTLCHLSKW